MIKKFCQLLIIIFLISIIPLSAFAAPDIKITISSDMDKVIFDGKWTHTTEWKRSSLDTLSYNDPNEQIKLRTAHQGNFVYVLIDFVSDTSLDFGKDSAVICFDINNDKTESPMQDDLCFTSVLGKESGNVLIGNDENNSFLVTNSPKDFISISAASDEADRYSEIPHSTYEFRIPTDFISRQSIYGFYVGVYDSENDKTFSWPLNVQDGPIVIPNPNTWGELISPDKSLPEFHFGYLVILVSIASMIFVTRIKNFKITLP